MTHGARSNRQALIDWPEYEPADSKGQPFGLIT